jgi:hypothetical protein
MNKYRISGTSIFYNNCDNEVNSKNRWDGSLPHYSLFLDVMHELGQLGFYVEKDKTISETIRKDHYYGRYNTLEFKANRYPAGFEIEFFQNINYENPNGGYYDFDKLDKMTYIQKLMFKKISNKLEKFFEQRGIICDSKPILKTSEEKIKYDFVRCWHHEQNDMNFNLSDLDGTTDKYNFNNTDRDKKTIYNGQIKYFRDRRGYLMKGKVYHNINNMWWVIINKDYYTNIADFELFDLTDDDYRGRKAKHKPPKEYVERKEKISQASIRELENEIRRRKKLAS